MTAHAIRQNGASDMATPATTPLDLREALYVYALDANRFDTVLRLLSSGFTPRRTLNTAADLTPCGQRAYAHLAALTDFTPCHVLANGNAGGSKSTLEGSGATQPV